MKRPTNQLEEWEWIEQYWSGKLSEAEKTYFEQRMNEDSRFAEEVEALRNGIQLLEQARLDQHVQQTLRDLRTQRRQGRNIQIWCVRIGTGMAAACVGFLLFLSLSPITLPGYENDWEVIRDLRGDYQTESTDHFSLRRKQAFDSFFEGQALLSEGQPQQAARQFEKVLAYSNLRSYFREAVQWHLVVCYLKTTEVKKAQELYKQLEDAEAYDIGRLERWKIGWQIRLRTWFVT